MDNIEIRGLNRLRFPNFGGKPTKYSPAGGARSFGVWLEDDIAKQLDADGWHVGYYIPANNTENESRAYLTVKLRFDVYPPSIVCISDGRKQRLDENTVGILDGLRFDNIDLVIRPYIWGDIEKHEVSAYLKTGYFTVAQDEFAADYANIPDADIPF